jgi:putative flippase GtrA
MNAANPIWIDGESQFSLMIYFKFLRFNHASYLQLFRYALVGIALNIIGYSIYFFLTSTGFTPKITMTFLYGAGVIIGFFSNKKFTFSYKDGFIGSGLRYGITHLFGYLLNLLIMVIFVDICKYSHTIVQGIAIFIVAVFLFLCFKFIVFRSVRLLQKGRITL